MPEVFQNTVARIVLNVSRRSHTKHAPAALAGNYSPAADQMQVGSPDLQGLPFILLLVQPF